ncbi:MFS general substrate transporter [Hypoxylon sp. NC1633]|nr:MFS general substrate transporter [Hypoxylon sp. NC1633]
MDPGNDDFASKTSATVVGLIDREKYRTFDQVDQVATPSYSSTEHLFTIDNPPIEMAEDQEPQSQQPDRANQQHPSYPARTWNHDGGDRNGGGYRLDRSRLPSTGISHMPDENTSAGQGDNAQSSSTPSKPHPRDCMPVWKWRALLVANCFITIMHGYDVSNVANIQASIYRNFGNIELLPWVALSYSVCNVALGPLGRKLFKFGDFKVLYLASMMFIIAGSALSGAATNIESIIAGRAIMALGSSVVFQGILSFNIIFTYPREIGLVQGSIGASFALGLVLGPIIGGAFADNEHTTWRWAFYLVIPLCVISMILQALFCPRYRVPTDKSIWTHIREIDWVGNLLHMGASILFAISCTFLGSIDTWGTSSAIATWVVFTFVVITYALQQAHSISTTPENRLLSSFSLFGNRTVLLTWICTFCAAASYGITLYYVPIFFAFTRGLGPLPGATRLLPFIFVFIFTIIVSGGLLPVLRFYKAFFLLGSAFLLIGGGLFQTLNTDTSESAVMGFETLIAAGLGVLWQLGVAVCTTFLQNTEDRLDLALLSNMAQLGGIAVSLSIAGMVYQSTGFKLLKDAVGDMGFSDGDIHELLAGVDSPILKGGDPEVLRLAVGAITDAVKDCFVIILAVGALCFLAAWSMKWEALEFKKPTGEQSGNNQPRRRGPEDVLLLDDLQAPGQDEPTPSQSAAPSAVRVQDQA